ncbi:MAG: glutamate--tRNA ligase [Pseudomonadota bacterium]
MSVITRFAPSPTGYLHVGGARTALFSWLYARQQGGRFILRIEDTDQARSSAAAVQAILDGMNWLGLDYDAEPVYQTDRFVRYDEVITQLLAAGSAYRCTCSTERLTALRAEQLAAKQKPRYDGHCRNRQVSADQPHVVRFCQPAAGDVVFTDQVRGTIQVQNQELDDLIIRRTDGTPTYNLTVVVDDHDMGITHVIRGDDHINNTPRQIHLYRALGWDHPTFAHIPMILGEDGSRLSKRHGAVSVLHYRETGFLPEAMLNYLARLGWSHGDQEIFSQEELIQHFSLTAVNIAPASFNLKKLHWLNQHYLKTGEVARLADLLLPHLATLGIHTTADVRLQAVIAAQRERAGTLAELARISAFYYQDFDTFEPKAAKKAFKGNPVPALQQAQERLAALDTWQQATIHQAVADTVAALDVGFGKVALPLRVAVTGGMPSPELDLTLELVGRTATLRRITQTMAYLQGTDT